LRLRIDHFLIELDDNEVKLAPKWLRNRK
jgi:hypothetical protein